MLRRLLLALAVLAGAALARGSFAASDEPVPWSAAFAAETDTAVFLTASGVLLRAPFHLASRETLWVPRGEERVARFRVSPDGRRVAWLGRAGDQDTTRLWEAGPGPAHVRVRFTSLQPSRFNVLRYESASPTLEDPVIHGARLVQGSALMRRFSVNPLAWTEDGGSIVFGYDDGLCVARPDTGIAREVSKVLVMDLRPLEPSTIFLSRSLVLHETKLDQAWYLLYPTGERWRIFSTSGFDPSKRWAASTSGIWWADGRVVRSVRVHDPTPAVEAETDDPVSWIGYDPAGRVFAVAAGRSVLTRSEDGGAVTRAFATGASIRQVLVPSPPGARWGFVAGDSLLLWRPGDAAPRGVRLEGFDPSSLFIPDASDSASNTLLGQPGGRGPLRLARAAAGAARLTLLDTPKLKSPEAVTSPSGRYLLLFEPSPRPPGIFEVWDLVTGSRTRVLNPGLIAWEVAPR